MSEEQRKEIVEAFEVVDRVVLTFHEPGTNDISICKELGAIRPDIFAKGGDRTADNIPEFTLCRELGIKMAFNVGHGGKVQSSSWLIKNLAKQVDDFAKLRETGKAV